MIPPALWGAASAKPSSSPSERGAPLSPYPSPGLERGVPRGAGASKMAPRDTGTLGDPKEPTQAPRNHDAP
eukprot:4642527-Pyramimonas_sp.AAC.1